MDEFTQGLFIIIALGGLSLILGKVVAIMLFKTEGHKGKRNDS